MRLALALLLAILPVPALASEAAPDEPQPMRGYRLKGASALLPVAIGDDGRRTYIQWRDDQPMPATFAIGADGQEEIVDGYVRAGIYTIDRVYPRLVFRIDKLAVMARREGS
jgi:type IV secretory pathway VirB9-like protein